MTADEIAWHNQKIACERPSAFAGLGSLGPIAPHERRKPTGEFSGRAAFFIVNRIKDAVEQARFQGRDLSIWVSSGWLSKTFTVKGDASDVAAVERWVFKCFGER